MQLVGLADDCCKGDPTLKPVKSGRVDLHDADHVDGVSCPSVELVEPSGAAAGQIEPNFDFYT